MTRIGSLFSGYGGLEQGVQSVLGGSVAWHSEIDPGACKILGHRYPDVPNLGDIMRVGLSYSDEEWAEIIKARQFHGLDYELPEPDWSGVDPVDVLVGGFPCQDVSAAGKRAGIKPGTRSGLWAYFAHAIDQLRPGLVVIENVRGLLSAAAEHPAHGDLEPCPWCVGDDEPVTLRALGAVLGELADLGYDASWQGLRAADVGAPHGRFRVFVTAWPAADASSIRQERRQQPRSHAESDGVAQESWAGLHPHAAPHTHGAARSERRLATPGQAESRGARADARGRGGAPTAHPEGHGRHEGRPEPARLVGGSDAAVSSAGAPADADRDGLEGVGGVVSVGRDADGCRSTHTAWGNYEPAIRRWERRLGRPAPITTDLGKNGQPRLAPAFVEWLMGLPAGWVTDVPGLSRNEQLKALGNGVVPQQAAAALRLLLPDVMGAAA